MVLGIDFENCQKWNSSFKWKHLVIVHTVRKEVTWNCHFEKKPVIKCTVKTGQGRWKSRNKPSDNKKNGACGNSIDFEALSVGVQFQQFPSFSDAFTGYLTSKLSRKYCGSKVKQQDSVYPRQGGQLFYSFCMTMAHHCLLFEVKKAGRKIFVFFLWSWIVRRSHNGGNEWERWKRSKEPNMSFGNNWTLEDWWLKAGTVS